MYVVKLLPQLSVSMSAMKGFCCMPQVVRWSGSVCCVPGHKPEHWLTTTKAKNQVVYVPSSYRMQLNNKLPVGELVFLTVSVKVPSNA